MRKIVLGFWVIIIISFSGLFIYSITYEIDAFNTIVNFKFQVSEVTIIKNDTGHIVNLRLNASVWNPSYFSSFELLATKGYIFLNGEAPEYLGKQKWFLKTILPREDTSVTWSYDINRYNVDIFNEADANGTWNWFFFFTINLDSNIVGMKQYERSQPFQGVEIKAI